MAGWIFAEILFVRKLSKHRLCSELRQKLWLRDASQQSDGNSLVFI